MNRTTTNQYLFNNEALISSIVIAQVPVVPWNDLVALEPVESPVVKHIGYSGRIGQLELRTWDPNANAHGGALSRILPLLREVLHD